MNTRNVTVDFRNAQGYTDTYIVTVPADMREDEVNKRFKEATEIAMIAAIADIADAGAKATGKGTGNGDLDVTMCGNGCTHKTYTADALDAARLSLQDYGNCPEGFMHYLYLRFGWNSRKNDSSDYCITYGEGR